MELEIYHYAIILAGGIIAGGINTLAGYGSIITLSILMDVLGLPGNMANGTNRVNVLANSAAGAAGFMKGGDLDLAKCRRILVILLIGAIGGVLLAVNVDNSQFRAAFKYIVIVIFLALLVKPKRWLIEDGKEVSLPLWKSLAVYLPIGFYAGFIQMGTGILFLMSAVLINKYSIMRANVLKLIATVVFTIMSLGVFHYHGLVDWKIGALLSIGTAIGGYYTAIIAPRYDKANLYAYYTILVVVIVVMIRLFVT